MSANLFAEWIAEETNLAAGPALFAPAGVDPDNPFIPDLPPSKPKPVRSVAPTPPAAPPLTVVPDSRPALTPENAGTLRQAAPPSRPIVGKLVDIYRPKSVADLQGQQWAFEVLSAFLENPTPGAFVFSGPTGTGKTSAALALAADLGCDLHFAECGGVYQIASGEQTGETVRDAMRGLRCRPMYGSGWRVLVVNEADCISANAAYTWLDALENLPVRSVVIFTTNDPQKLPRRLRDRCEEVVFVGGALVIRPALEALARKVWREQVGRDDCPDIDSFGTLADEEGNLSFRRLLQLMEPYVRVARAGGPVPAPCAQLAEPEAPVKAKRSRKGKVPA